MIEIKRETKETEIFVKLDIEGSGKYDIKTGIGFFDHMLESFSKHSQIDLEVECKGDIHVDFHHSVEDVGIVIGEALYKAIYPLQNRERFGDAIVVMDEAAVESALDLSNRPFLVYDVDIDGKIGEFDAELFEEFFRALVFNAKITAHIVKKRGKNRHHIAEAAFKSFAVALRRALKINEKAHIPSTKGVV
ncbi:imidazoleglycerol-phosphate dehydratase HisB [Nitrosophilus kaiyonis]|uniref:imidazoleglycerol-phosphate dehydratase HisB n=1 Tax=Nitrosophilus kaiyonis TaxID=2930200 RepID=UPI00248F5D32|nr:imidazoleglycerol-phosphate dehydratase HisB [Nitrosophilus kaiyonis]